MANKLTKSWRLSSLVALIALCYGCGNKEAPKPDNTPAPLPINNPYGDGEIPKKTPFIGELYPDSRLGLISGPELLRVGDSERRALDLFPKPAKQSFDRSELPPMLDKPFRARGWESKMESFGLILLNGQVIVAVIETEAIEREFATEKVELYRKTFNEIEPQIIVNQSVSYWFWNLGRRRLMICLASNRDKTLGLTIALGDESMMDALRMDAVSAAKDARQAATLLNATKN